MKKCRRIDGKQGGTGKVIKNSSYRCFWNTSKWCACQCQSWAWCIIEMVPTWHLPLTSHARSTWHHAVTWVTLWVTPPRINPAPSVMKGIRGNGTHAQHRPQRHQTGACAVCKLSLVNEKWGGRKCSCEGLRCISSPTLLVFCVRVDWCEYFSPTQRIYASNRILPPRSACNCLFKFTTLHSCIMFRRYCVLSAHAEGRQMEIGWCTTTLWFRTKWITGEIGRIKGQSPYC